MKMHPSILNTLIESKESKILNEIASNLIVMFDKYADRHIHKGIHKTCVIINLTQSLIESLYLGIDYVQKLILKITLKKFKRLKFYIFLFFEIFVFQ